MRASDYITMLTTMSARAAANFAEASVEAEAAAQRFAGVDFGTWLSWRTPAETWEGDEPDVVRALVWY